MMEQPVEDGGSQSGVVVEDLRPFAVIAIGDDGRAAFVPLADDLEQQIGAGFVDGEVSELVKQQYAGFHVAVEALLEPVCGLGGGQRVDDVDGAGEERRVACGVDVSQTRHRKEQIKFRRPQPVSRQAVGVESAGIGAGQFAFYSEKVS